METLHEVGQIGVAGLRVANADGLLEYTAMRCVGRSASIRFSLLICIRRSLIIVVRS